MSQSYVCVIETDTVKAVRVLGPMSHDKADKAVRGILRNLNQDKYHAAVIHEDQIPAEWRAKVNEVGSG